MPAVDELLVVVRAIREEPVIIQCENRRATIVAGSVKPGLQTPEARRGMGIAQYKCSTSFVRAIWDISIIIPHSLSFLSFFLSYIHIASMRDI